MAIRDAALELESSLSARGLEHAYLTHEAKVDTTRLQQFFLTGEREQFIEKCLQLHQNLLKALRRQVEQLGQESNIWDLGRFANNNKHHASFCKKMEEICDQCSTGMIELAMTIIAKAHDIVGDVGADFEVIGFGSLARQEMTPFSDLEYMIIAEENCSEESKSRLHHLAVTSYFLISNLRQTNLKYMNIAELKKIKFIDMAPNGFKIDGLGTNAGNIPTGNGGKNGKQLILTPSELYDLWKHELTRLTSGDVIGDFSDLLTSSAIIYQPNSHSHLLQDFNSLLPEDRTTLLPQFFNRKLNMLQQDLKKFSFQPDENIDQGPTEHNAKEHFHRFPSLLMFDLKILLQLKRPTAADTLQFLQEDLGTPIETINGLRLQLALANFIRISAYLKANSQYDAMSLLPMLDGTSSTRYTCPESVFITYCSVLIPLRTYLCPKLIGKSVSLNSLRTILAEMQLTFGTPYHLARSYQYKGNFPLVIETYGNALRQCHMDITKPTDLYAYLVENYDSDVAFQGIGMVGDAYDESDQPIHALGYFKYWRRLIVSAYGIGMRSADEVMAVGRIGIALHKLKRHDEAADTQEWVLQEIGHLMVVYHQLKQKGVDLKVEMAHALMNLGNIRRYQNRHEEANELYHDAIELYNQTENTHQHITRCLISKIDNLIALRSLQQATTDAKQCQTLCDQIYGEHAVYDSAAKIAELRGLISLLQCKSEDGLKELLRGVNIREKLYARGETSELAKGFANLGTLLVHWFDTAEGETQLLKAVEIYNRLNINGVYNEELAACHTTLGSYYVNKNEYENALTVLTRAKGEFSNRNGVNFAACLRQLGIVKLALDQREIAMEFLHEAIRIAEQLNDQNADIILGLTLCTIGQSTEPTDASSITYLRRGIKLLTEFPNLPRIYLTPTAYACKSLAFRLQDPGQQEVSSEAKLQEATKLMEKVSLGRTYT